MAWTEITRGRYQRDDLRYASDTTDEEWKVIAPCTCRRRPIADARARPTCATSSTRFSTSPRPAANGGCCPRELPPYTTVQRYFYAWRDSGVWQTINHVLLMDVREAAGREASPTAGVIDSQSVETTESAGRRVVRTRRPADHHSRARRWLATVAELLVLQAEYEAWLEALPTRSRTPPPPRRCARSAASTSPNFRRSTCLENSAATDCSRADRSIPIDSHTAYPGQHSKGSFLDADWGSRLRAG